MARTASGKRCQKWSAQSPHKHDQPAYHHNYCRNPDSEDGGVWCYTEDPDTKWEYCSQVQGLFEKILFSFTIKKTLLISSLRR